MDGTSAFPQEAKLRFAAWAITAVPGGAGTFDNQLLMGGHVSGLCQSPYREVNSSDACGDLVNQTWSPCQAPWCDCQGVVRGLGRLLQGRPLRRNAPHSDLWKRVQLAVVDNEALISIQKVVSHGSMKCATNPLEDWVYWHNNLADQAAASINLRRPNEFWVAWGAKQHALNFHRKLHAAIQLVLLETSRIAVQAQQLPKPEPVVDLQPDPVLQVPAAWSIPPKLVKRYGSFNLQQVHNWWTEWGPRMMRGDQPLKYIAGIQLFLSIFTQVTRVHGAFPSDGTPKRRRYQFLHVTVGAIGASFSCSYFGVTCVETRSHCHGRSHQHILRLYRNGW